MFLDESPDLRKLSIHIVSMAEGGAGTQPAADIDYNEKSAEDMNKTKPIIIDDVISFKSSHPLYPLPKPFNNITRKGTSSKF